MLRGHLDALTPGGFAEGWAFDDAAEGTLLVSLRDAAGEELGRGAANLFRADLAEVGYRRGWCSFRLRLSRGPEQLRGTCLSLHEARSGARINASDTWRVRESADAPCTTVQTLVAQDPTVLRSVMQLQGCGDLFTRFVARHGVAGFIRAAYAYLLDRSPDEAGLASYERLLRSGALTPFGLLLLLADSAEFREKPRLLTTPADPGFVFLD